MQSEGCQP